MRLTRRLFLGLGGAALAAALALAAANLVLGDLNQDEGWYLYAARLVASGRLPYRDFAFTQGPVMPLVYAAFEPLTQAAGLAGGRLATALLGLAASLAAAGLARRLAAPGWRGSAALCALILASVNVYHSYYFTVVKTYSLTALLLTGGFWILAHAWTSRRAGVWFAAAGALMALAAGVRSSAGIVLPIALAGLWLARRGAPRGAWLAYGAGAAAAGVSVFGPFLLAAPDALIYCVVRFHTLRDAGGGLITWAFKAGFLSRLVQAYFVLFALGVAALLATWARRRAGAVAPEPGARTLPREAGPVLRMLGAGAAAISLVHFLAPFPYEDYQVFVMPLAAVLVAWAAARQAGPRGAAWLTLGLLIVSLGAAGSSPVNQDWFIQGRDRIWWKIKDRTPLQKLRDTAARLRAEAPPGSLLLTLDPYLAVESGLALPRGLEMGQFSYFPELDDRQAAALHVFNRAGLERLLQTTEAPLAAMSGYALAIRAPEILPLDPADEERLWSLVRARYEPAGEVPHFGQAATTLRLFRKKE